MSPEAREHSFDEVVRGLGSGGHVASRGAQVDGSRPAWGRRAGLHTEGSRGGTASRLVLSDHLRG
jgi:hypothetical protein